MWKTSSNPCLPRTVASYLSFTPFPTPWIFPLISLCSWLASAPDDGQFFASSTHFIALLSGLQTLSIDVSSLGLSFAWTDKFYAKFWKGIGRLLPAATNMASLLLSSDRLSSGPPCEAWDAIELPSLTSLKLKSFVFSDRMAFGGLNTGIQAFLQWHLQPGSRLREVALRRCCLIYDSGLVWAMVYDKIADLLSMSFHSVHSVLKSFKQSFMDPAGPELLLCREPGN